MKVAFLNCTDVLNPKAGSELTCVFLDKIPGTIEFCKTLKLKDPNLYFDAYVHNGQHVNASYGYLKAGVPATVEVLITRKDWKTLRERWFGFATIEQTQTQPKNQFVELSPLRWW